MILEIQVEPDQFSDDELIAELESRGEYKIIRPDEDQSEFLMDRISSVYRDFLLWKDDSLLDSSFEESLKKFFSKTLDEMVIG